MREDSLGFSGMAIISPQSCGGWLQNWGSKFLPNQGGHNARGCPLIHYASVHNQVPDGYQDLEGNIGGHAWLSVLYVNVISLESEGSTTPRVDSRDFRYIGHVLSTSRVDIVVGVWAKSSTML